MTVTVQSFMQAYPEFFDGQQPQPNPAIVKRWIDVAYKMLPAERWDDMLDDGVMLYVAHNLALQTAQIKAGAAGGVAGQLSGPVASKAVDKVSVSYDTGAAQLENGGDFNLTVYGVQFLRLARMFGSGGIQL